MNEARVLVIVLVAIVAESLLASDDSYKSYKRYKLIEVEGHPGNVRRLVNAMLQLDRSMPIKDYKDRATFIIPPETLSLFHNHAKKNKLRLRIVSDDVSELINNESRGSSTLRIKPGFSWIAYYDVDDIYEWLKNMSITYSNYADLVVGGQSYEKRQLLGLRINSNKAAGKPAVFIESGIHAREWITPATTTYFINQLLTSKDPDIMHLRDQYDWHIFPTVNPDGYHHTHTKDRYWRKTRSKSSNGCYGADPNRNWDYHWLQHGATSDSCDYQTYGGSKPFCEIETRSLSEYIAKVENLLAYIAFHADAQALLVPFSDSTDHVSNYDDLIKIGNTSLEYGRKVNGEQYRGPATAAEILYKASGGSMDWVRHALDTKLVYTYELRGHYFMWPAPLIYQQGDEVTQMILGLMTEAKNLGYTK